MIIQFSCVYMKLSKNKCNVVIHKVLQKRDYIIFNYDS